MMYYLAVVKMGLAEDTFFRSSVGKIIYLLEQYRKEKEAMLGRAPREEQVKTAHSFSEIIGGADSGK